ncbi:MAG: hypothetical protein AB1657_02755 [Candidatus Micrarchaeota archaeon]
MGILDFLLGKEEKRGKAAKEEAPGAPMATKPVEKPFAVSTKFSSLRLKAERNSKIFLEVAVKNLTGTKQLVSVDLNLPLNSKIGFDVGCNQNYMEKRLGEIMPGASATFTVPIYGSNLTKEGSYTVEINAFSHYLDYRKVLSQMKKKIALRAVAGP